jgi:hypothetical protein
VSLFKNPVGAAAKLGSFVAEPTEQAHGKDHF